MDGVDDDADWNSVAGVGCTESSAEHHHLRHPWCLVGPGDSAGVAADAAAVDGHAYAAP